MLRFPKNAVMFKTKTKKTQVTAYWDGRDPLKPTKIPGKERKAMGRREEVAKQLPYSDCQLGERSWKDEG